MPITLSQPLTRCLLLDQGGNVRHLAARGSHAQALSRIKTPLRANAIAERWIAGARRESLDRMLLARFIRPRITIAAGQAR